MASLDSGVPIRKSLLASYLEFLQWVRGFLYFWRKDAAKRFPESYSPLPRTHPLCPRWRVSEISTLIGLHVPRRRKYPWGISPRFLWLWKCSSHTSVYALSANQYFTRRLQCTHQYNVRPCTPWICDVLLSPIQPRDSLVELSVRSWTISARRPN